MGFVHEFGGDCELPPQLIPNVVHKCRTGTPRAVLRALEPAGLVTSTQPEPLCAEGITARSARPNGSDPELANASWKRRR